MTFYQGRRIDEELRRFLCGEDVKLDERFVKYEILAVEAHTLTLLDSGIIDLEKASKILLALEKAQKLYKEGKFKLKEELEDVHTNLEEFVINEVGIDFGGYMTIARSRNDLVQTDTRMYMRDEVLNIAIELVNILGTLLRKAEGNIGTIIPAYTHLRQAQPTTAAHWLLSHVDPFIRDLERLLDFYERMNFCPLGAAAVAGTTLPVKRSLSASLLGFKGVQENTLDVSSSRGEFEAELLSILSLISVHLSRICEDLILWSTSEFDFVELAEEVTFESSLMPQKRNPDPLEVIRAKTGGIIGNLIQIMIVLKGLPSGYNRDSQECKKPLITSIDVVKDSVKALNKVLKTVGFRSDEISSRIRVEFLTATDLAEYLTLKFRIPFREAYRVVAKAIGEIEKTDSFEEKVVKITDTIGELVQLSSEEVKEALNLAESIKKRSHIGGPSPKEVRRMILERGKRVLAARDKIDSFKGGIESAFTLLKGKVREVIEKSGV